MSTKKFPTESLAIFFALLFVTQAIWNIYLYTLPSHFMMANYWFNVLYGATPFLIGLIMLYYVFRRRFGGEIASAVGYLGMAAVAFGLGLFFWSYYNIVLHVDIPHPSVGDAFFLVYPWLLVVGTLRLLRFYTPRLRWPVLLEALVVFFIAAVPFYHYLIVPSLGPHTMFIDKLNIFDTLIANAVVLGLVYLLIRIGGGRLRTVLTVYSVSYLALSASQFVFQYQTDNNTYWNGDTVDSLLVLHFFLFALATIYLLDSILNPAITPTIAPPMTQEVSHPQKPINSPPQG